MRLAVKLPARIARRNVDLCKVPETGDLHPVAGAYERDALDCPVRYQARTVPVLRVAQRTAGDELRLTLAHHETTLRPLDQI